MWAEGTHPQLRVGNLGAGELLRFPDARLRLSKVSLFHNLLTRGPCDGGGQPEGLSAILICQAAASAVAALPVLVACASPEEYVAQQYTGHLTHVSAVEQGRSQSQPPRRISRHVAEVRACDQAPSAIESSQRCRQVNPAQVPGKVSVADVHGPPR